MIFLSQLFFYLTSRGFCENVAFMEKKHIFYITEFDLLNKKLSLNSIYFERIRLRIFCIRKKNVIIYFYFGPSYLQYVKYLNTTAS